MSRGQWEDDDDLYGEGSDLGDDDDMGDDEDLEDEAESAPPPPPPPPVPAPSVQIGPTPVRTAEQRPRVVLNTPTSTPRQNGKPRRLKVKPMSAGMRSKWPDVTSCLLTLTSGQQVMFVRG